MTFRTNSEIQTIEAGYKIGSFLQKGDVIALQGTLGAGKTVITKGIAKALGITQPITSPTFCLICEYEGKIPLYHMDVYRLQDEDDFFNIGAEDLLYGNGICVIEWSEKIMSVLPSESIIIRLETDPASCDQRIVTLENWHYGTIDCSSKNAVKDKN